MINHSISHYTHTHVRLNCSIRCEFAIHIGICRRHTMQTHFLTAVEIKSVKCKWWTIAITLDTAKVVIGKWITYFTIHFLFFVEKSKRITITHVIRCCECKNKFHYFTYRLPFAVSHRNYFITQYSDNSKRRKKKYIQLLKMATFMRRDKTQW